MSNEASNTEVLVHAMPPGLVPPPEAGFRRLPEHIRTHTLDFLDKEIAQARRERENLSADSQTFADRARQLDDAISRTEALRETLLGSN
ncbi:hypothetical protein U746_2779 [Mycolicibacterium mucogenicum 261Sha1.1M5]|nr:hypothetical protein U746_2779 [Mycolicibacterium mucogenicum 261Sha1.1M5]